MELSGAVLEGLAACGEEAHFNKQAFALLVEGAIKICLRQSTAAEAAQGIKASVAVLKEAQTALVTMLLEAAKHNTSASEITAVLEDAKILEDRASLITAKYTENVTEIRSVLAGTAFNYPHLIDVDWRLDYYIKNNHLEKVNEPVYLIKLKTDVSGSSEGPTVQFTASPEHLQDLINKLKDAAKKLTPDDGKK